MFLSAFKEEICPPPCPGMRTCTKWPALSSHKDSKIQAGALSETCLVSTSQDRQPRVADRILSCIATIAGVSP